MSAEKKVVELGDFVFFSGGGTKRFVEVKANQKMRLQRSSAVQVGGLAGMRYGEVVEVDHATGCFVRTNAYPDLDLTDIRDEFPEDGNDNRNLLDNNKNQALSPEEVSAIRREKGLDALLNQLVEKSASFETKTSFSKEKYLKRKKKKFAVLFKIEGAFSDNIAETHIPTINPSDDLPDDSKHTRLRVDTVALIAHNANIVHDSHVLLCDSTNGVLAAHLLARLGPSGVIFQALRAPAQPNTYTASKLMQLPDIKTRWRGVPLNDGFLLGIEEPPAESSETAAGRRGPRAPDGQRPPSQWLKGTEAREVLLEDPADSLVIVDEENPEGLLRDLFPYLAIGGHVVIYSPFLSDLTPLFALLRSDCVHIRISETWLRHHQVLPLRTHPTVNMSTAGGYLLTAIKTEPYDHHRGAPLSTLGIPRTATSAELPKAVAIQIGTKRQREEDAAEAEKAETSATE